MKTLAMLFSAAVLAVAATSAFAGGGRGGPGGGATTNNLGMNTNFYTNEFELLSAQLTLADDQKPKVKARVDAMNAELQSVLLAAQNSGARGAAPAAGGGPGGRGGGGGFGGGGFGAPAAPTSLTPEQIKFRDDYQMLADQHQVKINSELTAPQKLQWETYKLNTFLDPKLSTLNLTEDQKDKVKTLVADCAKALAAMTDGKDIDTCEGKLIRKIIADVLTEPQAARLFELPLGTTSGARGGLPAQPARGGNPNGAGGGERGGRGGRN